jgi:branched-chain amino acid transport system ATP-binding protein
VPTATTLTVGAGAPGAIIGPNGAGKTTLLMTIAGILQPRCGTIQFDKKDIDRLAAERIVQLGCALVPEGRHLFSTLTVKENLLLGRYCRRGKGAAADISDGLEQVYRLFPILKERERQLAGTLSGGQQQMVAIGRALMSRPKLLMMDEPSQGLAPQVVRDIYQTIAALKRQGLTILLIEQNARAALAVADRGYVLETGQIVLEGTSAELCDNREVQRAYLGKEYRTIDE